MAGACGWRGVAGGVNVLYRPACSVGKFAAETLALWVVHTYSSWCPKAIATIRRLPETLSDRCCFLSASAERMFSRHLAAELNTMPDRPWGEMLKGKVVTELWLATQLRPYGILPKPVWIGELAARGYQKSDFTEVFQRYVPNEAAKRMLEELTAAAASHRDQPARETEVQVPRPNDNSTQAG